MSEAITAWAPLVMSIYACITDAEQRISCAEMRISKATARRMRDARTIYMYMCKNNEDVPSVLLYLPATQSVHSEAPNHRDRTPMSAPAISRRSPALGTSSHESVCSSLQSEDVHRYGHIHSRYVCTQHVCVYAFQILIDDRCNMPRRAVFIAQNILRTWVLSVCIYM